MSIKGQVPANFEFRALQVFVTTAEQGGMTKAAKVLGLTQSAVSQTIAALEEAVGKQLFDRAVRPIVTSNPATIRQHSFKDCLELPRIHGPNQPHGDSAFTQPFAGAISVCARVVVVGSKVAGRAGG